MTLAVDVTGHKTPTCNTVERACEKGFKFITRTVERAYHRLCDGPQIQCFISCFATKSFLYGLRMYAGIIPWPQDQIWSSDTIPLLIFH